MSEIALSQNAQQWVNVVLIWIGFGTLAGLLASVLLPLRGSLTPFSVMGMGIVGSMVGLFALSWLFPGQTFNPISPVGFFAASIGSFLLLLLHNLGTKYLASHATPKKEHE
jgi:uncharacterized membrane protein YeaQ/YmgE (transglycosylase-associated protein family)